MAYFISEQSKLINTLPLTISGSSVSYYSTFLHFALVITAFYSYLITLCLCGSLCLECSSPRFSQSWLTLTIQGSDPMFLSHLCKENSIFLLPSEINLFHCHIRIIVFTFICLVFVFPHYRIHSIKQILNTYYMAGTILGAENTLVK